MKNLHFKSFVPSFSLVASFMVAAIASYLLVAHFQHTVLQAWVSVSGDSSQLNTTDGSTVATAGVEEQPADFVCGCPFCCSGIAE